MIQHNSLKSYTEAEGIKLATPIYQLTVSPPAASPQRHRRDKVETELGTYVCDVTVLPFLIV